MARRCVLFSYSRQVTGQGLLARNISSFRSHYAVPPQIHPFSSLTNSHPFFIHQRFASTDEEAVKKSVEEYNRLQAQSFSEAVQEFHRRYLSDPQTKPRIPRLNSIFLKATSEDDLNAAFEMFKECQKRLSETTEATADCIVKGAINSNAPHIAIKYFQDSLNYRLWPTTAHVNTLLNYCLDQKNSEQVYECLQIFRKRLDLQPPEGVYDTVLNGLVDLKDSMRALMTAHQIKAEVRNWDKDICEKLMRIAWEDGKQFARIKKVEIGMDKQAIPHTPKTLLFATIRRMTQFKQYPNERTEFVWNEELANTIISTLQNIEEKEKESWLEEFFELAMDSETETIAISLLSMLKEASISIPSNIDTLASEIPTEEHNTEPEDTTENQDNIEQETDTTDDTTENQDDTEQTKQN